MWPSNCFVTLTYARDKLPGPSLHYADFQGFMKRLRQWRVRQAADERPGTSRASSVKLNPSFNIRFFVCGEYGPENLRPHFHACLFNIDFDDKIVDGKSSSGQVFYTSETLSKLWGFGKVSVQELNFSTAAYCARYIVDKVTGDAADNHYRSVDADGVITRRVAEFCRCSLKPGIGAAWFDRYGRDVFPHDFVVVDGKKVPPPKYYLKRQAASDQAVGSIVTDQVQFARQRRAKLAQADNTPERLAVREKVHAARVRNQQRKDP